MEWQPGVGPTVRCTTSSSLRNACVIRRQRNFLGYFPNRKSVNLLKRYLFYSGKRVRCPVCNQTSRRFAPFGYRPRRGAQCVWCGSLERHRLVWLYFSKEIFRQNYGPDSRFLHFAPEQCLETRFRRLFPGPYITADKDEPGAEMRFDITQIPFPDRHFDLIFCSHVLEHVDDDHRALRELYRVLSDRGQAVLLVPITAEKTVEDPSVIDPAERARLFGQPNHVRRYGPDFAERVERAGFTLTTIRPADFLSPGEIAQMGIKPDQIFLGRRPP